MLRIVRAAVLLMSMLSLGEPAAAEEDSAAPTWYAQAIARGDAGLNVTHFWSKGSALRAETVVAGHKFVTIVQGDWYYAYDALTGQGLKLRREPATVARDDPQRRPFGDEYEIIVRQGAELVREEQLLGRPTGVYRITDLRGRRELWVTQDALRIPLRIEIYDRESGQRRKTDYVNWQSDLAIPDSFFTPDPDARLDELDYSEYLRRSATEGSVGPVPVLYAPLLFTIKEG